MTKYRNLVGEIFYKLTVIDKREIYLGHFQWICKCECGKIIEVCGNYLNNGKKKSCGCWIKPRNKIPPEIRFWKFVEKTEECWIWNGCKTPNGYGHLHIRGKPYIVSRFSWELHKGKILDGLEVCHKCDNPACVNPDHLFLGTHQDNMIDMYKKGRAYITFGSQRKLSKLNENQVLEIRKLYQNPYCARELSDMYGVSKQNILMIVKRKAWKHI